MTLDTALPSAVQTQLEAAIRAVVSELDRTSLEFVRQVPPPESDGLDLELAPELEFLTVSSLTDQRDVGVHLFFDGEPDGDVAVIPEEVDEPAVDLPDDVAEREPTYLADLGGGYADLSEAIMRTLGAFCRTPDGDREPYFLGDRADLRCRSCHGTVFTFTTYVSYPEHVELAYADGDPELARRFGLPV